MINSEVQGRILNYLIRRVEKLEMENRELKAENFNFRFIASSESEGNEDVSKTDHSIDTSQKR